MSGIVRTPEKGQKEKGQKEKRSRNPALVVNSGHLRSSPAVAFSVCLGAGLSDSKHSLTHVRPNPLPVGWLGLHGFMDLAEGVQSCIVHRHKLQSRKIEKERGRSPSVRGLVIVPRRCIDLQSPALLIVSFRNMPSCSHLLRFRRSTCQN